MDPLFVSSVVSNLLSILFYNTIMKKEEAIEFKILVVGDPASGKTSFIHQFTNNIFVDKISCS